MLVAWRSFVPGMLRVMTGMWDFFVQVGGQFCCMILRALEGRVWAVRGRSFLSCCEFIPICEGRLYAVVQEVGERGLQLHEWEQFNIHEERPRDNRTREANWPIRLYLTCRPQGRATPAKRTTENSRLLRFHAGQTCGRRRRSQGPNFPLCEVKEGEGDFRQLRRLIGEGSKASKNTLLPETTLCAIAGLCINEAKFQRGSKDGQRVNSYSPQPYRLKGST